MDGLTEASHTCILLDGHSPIACASQEVVEEIRNRKGLAKKSTYVEDLLRKALGLDEEGHPSRPIARSVR